MAAIRQTHTVADKLASIDQWRERVLSNTEDYATEEWKQRALSAVERAHEATARFPAHTPLLTPGEALASDLLTEVEKWAIRWQYRDSLALGSFTNALLTAARQADGGNLDKLEHGWPALVEAIRRWRNEEGFSEQVQALLR